MFVFQSEYHTLQKPTVRSTGSYWIGLAINIILATSFFGGPALAAPTEETTEAPELFLSLNDQDKHSLSLTAAPRTGYHQVQLNARLGDAFLPLPTVRLSLPNGAQYEAIQDNRMTHPSGSVTWVGHLKDYGSDYRVVITTQQGRSFGRILTPDGELRVESNDRGSWLIDSREVGLLPGDSYNDTVVPPAAELPDPNHLIHQLPSSMAEELVFQSKASASSTIDVMLLYTSGMASRYGSGLQARLDNLIAIANQSYLDSQVGITLRLVHKAQVDYGETTTNESALDALTNGSTAALSSANSWRDQYGADLVALLRPYNNANHGGCGVAWVNGYNGQALSAAQGYAVVSDGNDTGGSRYYCDDFALTHELGHTMGSQHDRANASFQGAYPYSYGYGADGTFGTIMSYIYPRVGKFSNPNISCSGGPCGVTDSADNARSLNNTCATVASFKATQAIEPPSTSSSKLTNISTRGWVGTGDSVMIGGFIISGDTAKKVLITAKGPTLTQAGVPSALNDPNLTLYNASGQPILSNDDWGTAANATEIQAHSARPSYTQEAAILTTLNPGAYTAIVRGTGSTTGNALVEVYEVQ